mgnify:CR=1 FL=1
MPDVGYVNTVGNQIGDAEKIGKRLFLNAPDLFLVHIMALLNDGGRCGMVLPDGFLFGGGVKSAIKQKLLADCNLHTIVRLPKDVFAPYTNINTNLLFFKKGMPTKGVWFYRLEMPEGYKHFSKTRPMLDDH